jgi:hypothetical protein
MAALGGWVLKGLDVRNAYLYGKLNEEIYMEQPEGFIAPGKETCSLLKACPLQTETSRTRMVESPETVHGKAQIQILELRCRDFHLPG